MACRRSGRNSLRSGPSRRRIRRGCSSVARRRMQCSTHKLARAAVTGVLFSSWRFLVLFGLLTFAAFSTAAAPERSDVGLVPGVPLCLELVHFVGHSLG